MERFKRILIAAESKEDLETLLPIGANVATRNKAKITVIKVINELPNFVKTALPHEYRIVDKEQIIQRELKHLKDSISDRHMEAIVKVGRPHIKIIQEVVSKNHDLLIIKSPKEKSLGGTTLQLLRKCSCPVWIHNKTLTEGPVLAAIDNDHDESFEVNKKIIEMASALATIQKRELLVVQAWQHFAEKFSKLIGIPDEITAEVNEAIADNAKKSLNIFLSRFTLNKNGATKIVVKGEAEKVIAETVDKYKVSTLVMGTLSRSGVAGLLIGNTAEKVVQQVNCSLLTVKPASFQSPIE